LKNGAFEGEGTLTLKDGSEYTGSFEGNKFHGKGKFINKKGSIYQGKWLKGK